MVHTSKRSLKFSSWIWNHFTSIFILAYWNNSG